MTRFGAIHFGALALTAARLLATVSPATPPTRRRLIMASSLCGLRGMPAAAGCSNL
jgi:hypothetical protein